MNSVAQAIDFAKTRLDFPVLAVERDGRPLIYLDNAATSQKPQKVIDRVNRFYERENANVHRGVHYLSELATCSYEQTRELARGFLNAASPQEVIFTRGCTESINMIASGLTSEASSQGIARSKSAWIREGDVVLVSTLEHHSNIVPWQMAAARVGAVVKAIPITDDGEIDLDAYSRLLRLNLVRVVAINHVSNALGTVNPVRAMISEAHRAGARVMVDGAQAGPHLRIDVQDLDADYYSLSCHKVFAPTGLGLLYGKLELLQELPPLLGGGDMIRHVGFIEGTSYAELPSRLEAGTPNIAGVAGFGAAIEYLTDLAGSLEPTFEQIAAQESELARRAAESLSDIPGLHVLGPKERKSGIVSFTIDGVHPHDIGTILDHDGIAIRVGHHCCMPLMRALGVAATARASMAFYNMPFEVERLACSVRKVKELFAP